MNQNNIKDYLQAYNTICPKQKFVYMSMPITTGPIFIQWYVETGQYLVRDSTEYTRLHHESVIFKNRQLSQQYAETLYQEFEGIVINPAEFCPDFTQEEFMLFWDEFIKEYVEKIVFMPGWALSKGSLAEYLIALNNRVTRLEYSNGKIVTLSKNDAIGKITKAEETLKSVGFNSHMQENVLKLLKDGSPKVRV